MKIFIPIANGNGTIVIIIFDFYSKKLSSSIYDQLKIDKLLLEKADFDHHNLLETCSWIIGKVHGERISYLLMIE